MIKIIKCKDCAYRYKYHCPLTVTHDTYSEDDGWDYYETYGRSEDDEFFCADGEIGGYWRHKFFIIDCSNCGYILHDNPDEKFAGEFPKICPECGAVMGE